MKQYINKILSIALITSLIIPMNHVTIFGETQDVADATPATETKASSTISLPDTYSYWNTFGGNNTGSGTIDSKTPANLKTMVAKSKIIPNQFFEPILVGNYLYSITDCQYLTKYDSDGEEIARTSLGATLESWISARMAYGDGKIFVEVNGRIKAYDAITLQPLWQSVDTGLQINGALTYYNGYLYAGTTDLGSSKGYFFALNTKDENTTSSTEEKDFIWKTENNKGHYWSSGVIAGNAIVFVGHDGKLISHHLTRDITFDTYDLGEDAKVRSNLLYIAESASVIIPTQKSKQLFKMGVNNDGTFQRESIQSLQLDNELSGGIAYYNGRIYASSGGRSGSGLQVIDEQSMQVIYKTSICTQSYPLITTAYATAENNYKVYIYIIDYNGGLVKLEDSQGQTNVLPEKISENFLEYNSNSIVGDINGNLYIYNGFNSTTGNRITIYSNPDSAYTATDIDNAVARISSGKARAQLTYEDIQQVANLQLRYNALSDNEKVNVTKKEELTTLVAQGEQINTSIITNLNDAIAAIDEVSASDIKDLEALWNTYGTLRDEDKNKISNFAKLETSLVKAYELQNGVEQLIKDIDALKDTDNITLKDKAEVARLKAAYDTLSDADKKIVTNVSKLDKAVDRIKYFVDSTKVNGLIKDIKALPKTVTLKDESNVNSLYEIYINLHKDVQKNITNAETILKLHDEITAQRKSVDQLNDDIWNSLNPRNVTLKDETLVNRLMKEYDELNDVNKTYIAYYSDVLMANEIIASLHKGIIPSIVFTNIKGSDITYSYEGNMNGYTYQMSFNGKNISKPMDVQAGMKATSDYDSLIKKEYVNAFIMNMDYVGALPGKTTITMNISTKNGTYKFYRFDTNKKQCIYVGDVNLQNESVSFDITEGGIYVIALDEAVSPKGVDTSDTTSTENQLLLVGTIISAIGCIVYIERKKRKIR